MSGFVKIYETILDSSIWGEAAGTRLVWITMLTMADENGTVIASAGGLARRANVSREETIEALRVLSEPDLDSKSPEFEGRRIEKIDGGWLILNHRKYRDMRTSKQIADAQRQAEWRKSNQKSSVPADGVTCHESHSASPKVSASASEISGSVQIWDPDPERAREEPASQAADEPTELERNSRLWLKDPLRASAAAPQPWTWRPVLEVTACFDRVFGGTPTRLRNWNDPRVRVVIERFADGSTPADLCVAIDGAFRDDHIRGNPQFQTLVTILRDASQVDRFTRLAKSSVTTSKVRNAGTDLLERAHRIAAAERNGGGRI